MQHDRLVGRRCRCVCLCVCKCLCVVVLSDLGPGHSLALVPPQSTKRAGPIAVAQ